MGVTPVNYRKQDASAEALARDVDYALQVATFYVGSLPGGSEGLAGARVLELGPGHSLGAAVLLACHGAQVTVADRFLAPWDRDYHPAFLAALRERLAERDPELSTAPIEALLAAGGWVPEGVSCLHVGSEELDTIADGTFDAVLSNAVFEHVEDVPRTLANLARITRPTGLGVHQVDFRDHRDFERPLEFLTLSSRTFREEFRFRKGECGNRWRHGALGEAMRAAGFDVLEFRANMHAEADYLADVRPRVQAEFRRLDPEVLGVLSGCFTLRRRSVPVRRKPVDEGDEGERARLAARYAFARRFASGRRVLDIGCGRGEGARELLAAGAEEIVALDEDEAAIEQARRDDPDARGERWQLRDPAGGLPGEDGNYGLIVCFDRIDRLDDLAARAALVTELRRVLDEDGVALVSRRLGGDPAAFEELVTLLSDFEWVEFHGQVDFAASAVLPLEGVAGARLHADLELAGFAVPGEVATREVIAECRRRRPTDSATAAPTAVAWRVHGDA